MKIDKREWQKKAVIIETLPSATFRVQLEGGKEAIAHLAGKVRKHHIRILSGDKVLVELSPYDETRGRIIYRL